MALVITWRGSIPNQPLRGNCEAVAQDTATAAGSTFVEVIIRGPDHSTTRVGGLVHIGRHITMNFKTTDMQQAGTHFAAHVFLDGARPDVWTINHVDWFGPNSDFVADEKDDKEAT